MPDEVDILPAVTDEQVYVPTLSVQALVELLEKVEEAKERVLKEGIDRDYSIIPGTSKPSLLKPGAEKLCQLFGYRIRSMDKIDENETPYGVGYKCVLHDSQGRVVGVCDGWADKSESKARTWNKNTVMKMAQKRAFVGATLWACNASGIFTQDVEDYGLDDDHSSQPSIDMTKKVTVADAGAAAFSNLVETVQSKLKLSEDEAREFMVNVCRNAGFTSTDDLADSTHLNTVRTKMLNEIDVRQGIELQQEDPKSQEQTPGTLVLKRLIEEFGSKLPQDSIWDIIHKIAKIQTVDELAEEGAEEMCVTLLNEKVEELAQKVTPDSSPAPEPGASSKATRSGATRSRSKATKTSK
jgi:hypothetical protein